MIENHPYEDITQINEFNAVADRIGMAKLSMPEAVEGAENQEEFEAYEIEQPQAQSIPLANLLKPLLRIGFDRFAPNWAVKDEECEQLADSYEQAIDYNFPDVAEKVTPNTLAIVSTLGVIAPRIGLPRNDVQVQQVQEDESQAKTEEVANMSKADRDYQKELEGLR